MGSSKLIFTHVAALVEHKRRVVTVQMTPMVIAEVWPPQDSEAERTAQRALAKVYETVDAISCAERIQKKLVMEYIRQVNSQIYSSNTLRDQMQALVLAISEIL